MSGLRVFRQDDFTGGLNLRADQFQLAPNESPRLLNVDIDPRGGVASRGAMRRTNAADIVATGWTPERVAHFYGGTHYVLVSTQTNVYWSSNAGSTYSLLGAASAVSDAQGAQFATWGSVVYTTGGRLSQSRKWDGTTVTLLTASGPTWQEAYTNPVGGFFPQARHCATHAGKIFVANTRENGVNFPNRIRWSHPNSPENWASNDFIDINDGSNGITAIAAIAGQLVVFKHNSVFAILGYESDSFQVVELSRAVGAANPHCVAASERAVYFYSPGEGLFMYNGQGIVDLFVPIRPAIRDGRINNALNDAIYVNYMNRKVWVSVPYADSGTATFPTVSFVYNPEIGRDGAWTMYQTTDGRGLSGGVTFTAENGQQTHLGAHPSTACTLQLDVENSILDNVSGTQTAFVSRYRTRWIDVGSYSQKKMFRRPDVVAKQAPVDALITLNIYKDYEEAPGTEHRSYTILNRAAGGGMLWNSPTTPPGVLGQWSDNPDSPYKWGSPNSGSQIVAGRGIGLLRSIQIEFVGPTNSIWGVSSYSLKYNPRKVSA